MTMFWDRKGEPIENVIAWARMYEDTSYRVVAVDTDEAKRMMVSTIWNGIPQATLNNDMPIGIFETAFLVDGLVADSWRSDTEAEAMFVHDEKCREFLRRPARPDDKHVQTIIENDGKERDATER